MLSKFSVIELRERVRWYVTMRWLYLLPLTIAGLVPLYVSGGWTEDFRRQSLVALLGIGLNVGVLLITSYRFHTSFVYLTLAAVQITFDIFLATWLLYQNGGIESRSVIVYAIPIMMTGSLFGRFAIYLTAAASALSYDLLITLDHYRVIVPPNIQFPFSHSDLSFYVRSLFFYTAVFIVLAVIADYVGRLLREREQLEQEMRALGAEKAETEAILKSVGSGLIAADRSGKIMLVNGSFEDLTGWKRQEVVGKQLDEVLPIFDSYGHRISADERPMMQFLQEGNLTPHVRTISSYSYERKDGSTFPFVAYLAPIVLNHRVIGSTTVFDDATNSKKLEQLKDNFVALVSHQLKTPLVEIRGYVENMLYGISGKLTKKQQEYLERIHDVSDRANKLISDLLDITVLEKGGLSVDIESITLSPVLEEVAHIYNQRLEQKGLKLNIKEDSPGLTVKADPDKLVEIIGNVVANSISYSKKGSITIQTKQVGEFGEVWVIDKGIGMDKATLDALFHKEKMLSGAPTAEGGTGLGLYLAKQLVTLMNGDIRVVSTSDNGTTISIKLPLGSK